MTTPAEDPQVTQDDLAVLRNVIAGIKPAILSEMNTIFKNNAQELLSMMRKCQGNVDEVTY
jgi:hypothetical protein